MAELPAGCEMADGPRRQEPPVRDSYSVAYADELMKAYGLLNEAADAVDKDDDEFARFLRNRARDLLSNDYESGDAAGSPAVSKPERADRFVRNLRRRTLRREDFLLVLPVSNASGRNNTLPQAMKGCRRSKTRCRYQNHKKVREDIPSAFTTSLPISASRAAATPRRFLPNESYLARRYGRTILLRANIMRDPNIFEGTSKTLPRPSASNRQRDLRLTATSIARLWHEVGPYLGVDRTKDGRDLDEALQDNANAMEEMKADLVSLFVAEALHKQGYYTTRNCEASTPAASCACCRTIGRARPALQHDAVDAVELSFSRMGC
jgi:hypothetical protein